MQGNLHAIMLLSLGVAGIAVAAVRGQRPTFLRGLLGLGVGALVASGLYVTHLHKCSSGVPVVQALVCGGSITLALVFVGRKALAGAVSVVFALGGIALCQHYVHLVHQDDWKGHMVRRYSDELVLEQTSNHLREAGVEDRAAYPAGFGSEVLGRHSSIIDQARGMAAAPEPVWHSAFTRLFRLDLKARGIWYPGGKLVDSASKIEIRAIKEPRDT